MTDVSNRIDTAQGAAPAPAQPTAGDPASGAVTGFAAAASELAEGVSIFARARAASAPTRAELREAAGQSLIGAYIERQQAVSAAVEAGEMTENEGSARSRAMFRQFSAANPGFATELADAHDKFVSPSLGPLVVDAQKETRAREAQLQAAIDAGAIDTNAPADQQEVQFRKYSATKAAEANLEFMTVMDNQRARAAFNYWVDNALDTNTQSYQTVANSTEIPMDQRLESLDMTYNQHLADIDRIGIKLDNTEDIDYAKSILKRSYDLQRKVILGEISTEAANAQLSSIKAHEMLQAVTGSPAIRRHVALSELGMDSASMLANSPDIMEAVYTYVKNGFDGKPIDTSDTAAMDSYQRAVLSPSIQLDQKGLLSPVGKDQLRDQMQALLGGASAFVKDVTSGRDFMSAIANPDIGDYLQGNPSETFNARFEAAETIRSVYGSELAGLIEQEIDPDAGVEPIWSNGGVQFRSNVPSETFRLNRKAAPLLNEYIRASTHLLGTKDYRKTWEDMKPWMFPSDVERQAILRQRAAERGVPPESLREDMTSAEIAEVINQQGSDG